MTIYWKNTCIFEAYVSQTAKPCGGIYTHLCGTIMWHLTTSGTRLLISLYVSNAGFVTEKRVVGAHSQALWVVRRVPDPHPNSTALLKS